MHNPNDFAFQPAGQDEWFMLDAFSDYTNTTIEGTLFDGSNEKRPIKIKGSLVIDSSGVLFIPRGAKPH